MSNAVATTHQADAAAVEKVILHGDLGSLSPAERINYYNQLCDHLGLNPVTQPFKILRLQGKEVLYATKDASEQLRKINGVSIDRKESETVGDVYVVTVFGHDKSGRTDMATGAVTIGSAKGDQLANALMKAETKAKRRLTLSICGLGVLDETELETIPAAQRDVSPAQPTEDELAALSAALRKEIDDAHLDALISEEQRKKIADAIPKYRDSGDLPEYAATVRARLATIKAELDAESGNAKSEANTTEAATPEPAGPDEGDVDIY